MKQVPVSIVAALALALILPGAALADDHVWVALQGPIGQLPQPRPDYTLEIGDLGWRVDGRTFDASGSPATVTTNAQVVVRVRRLSDCAPIVSFVARPGTSWIIRFVSGTSLRVEDWTKNGLDMLGGMPAGGPLLCPRLPDTATLVAPPGYDRAPPVELVGISLLAGLALVAARLRRRTSSRLTPQVAPLPRPVAPVPDPRARLDPGATRAASRDASRPRSPSGTRGNPV